ncbi:MAG: AbrB/MazE/SpoVT family DNA-binding domain-containing protein [Candidatus Aminicenantes bacterium]|nr:AbrB/MazE/SpoVT family DNA-binding domain-containing protein [Candidatus Aminicenantes bacterium]
MQGKIQKWGNSLGLRIQKAVAEQARIMDGSEVDITVSENRLIITPARSRYTLEGLLAGVNSNNLHGEIDTGCQTGREEW